MIEQFAYIYVNILEPLGQAFIVFLIIITVLWLLIVVNDAEKGKGFITNVFGFMWRGFAGFLRYTGLAIWEVTKFLLRALQVVVAAVRDFLVGKV
jgi:hypothetical protein